MTQENNETFESTVAGVKEAAGGCADEASGTLVPAWSSGALTAFVPGKNGNAVDIPKPFATEICLIPETRIAGTSHIENMDEIYASLSLGSKLTLVREPKNAFDRWAIRISDARGNKLGYVSADVNEIIARLMDGGKHVCARIVDKEVRDVWYIIQIEVILDD